MHTSKSPRPAFDSSHSATSRPRRLAWAGLLLCVGALGGFLVAQYPETASARQATDSPYRKLAVFARVLGYIETEYVEEVDRELVIEEAIRGLLRRLDPHSQFYTASQVKDLQATLTGQHSGAGLTISRRKGQAVVQSADPGGPAALAGIRPGDLLLSVDGMSVLPLDVASITVMLRGQRGTRVVLEIRTPGDRSPRSVVLLRNAVRSVDVQVAALSGGLGYVVIRRFSHGVTRQVRQAIGALRKIHNGKLTGLVLDLRDNPGGLMDEGIRLADLFLVKGLIVRKVGKRGRLQEKEVAHRKGTEETLPLAVIVNRGTASAAEIVAAALVDHQRATLVGDRSFGKGSMQSIISLPDGSRLKLTVARYYRPSGPAIEGIGIQPQILVAAGPKGTPYPPAGAMSGSDGPLAPPVPPSGWYSRDPQLSRAINALVKSEGTGPP